MMRGCRCEEKRREEREREREGGERKKKRTRRQFLKNAANSNKTRGCDKEKRGERAGNTRYGVTASPVGGLAVQRRRAAPPSDP